MTGPETVVAASPHVGRNLPKLRFLTKIGYGAGGMVDGITTQAIGIFLLFYATSVCGLPGTLAGASVAIGSVLDAFLDPYIGSLSDRWRSRLGRRLPFMLVGLPIAALALISVFSIPAGLSHMAIFAWLTASSIALRTALSLYSLPYMAAGAEMTDDGPERASLQASRFALQMIGTLLIVFLGYGVFFKGDGGLTHRPAYGSFALAGTSAMVVAALIAAWVVFKTRSRQHKVSETVGHDLPFLKQVAELLRNRTFVTLFLGSISLFAALGIHSALSIHANTHFWHLTTAQMQIELMSLFAGLLIGAPLAGPLLKRFEKRTVLCLGQFGLGVAFMMPVCLRLAGALPLEGNALVVVLATANITGGILMAASAVALPAMLTDATDEHEYLHGGRREGLFFAGWLFALKTANGLGPLFAGIGLDLIGFKSAVHTVAAPVVESAGTVAGLGAIYGLGSGLMAILASLVCLGYGLTAQKHTTILIELGERRSLRGV